MMRAFRLFGLAIFVCSQALPCKAQPVGQGDAILHLGTNGFASLPSSELRGFDYGNDFSLEIILNIDAYAAGGRWPVLLGKKTSPPGADAGFALSINQGQFKTAGQQVYGVVADGVQQVAVMSRSFQGVVHAVLTWDRTARVARLYMNGNLETAATNTALVGALTNAADVKLGGPSLYGTALQRDVVLARLWNRVLTSAEVTNIWAGYSTKSAHPLPANFDRSALVSEWLMEELSDPSHIKDSAGNNPLQLQGAASLWQGAGPLVLQSPSDGAIDISKAVTLRAAGGLESLAAASRPLQYEIQVDERNTFDSPAFKSSGWIPHVACWKPVLKPSTRYFWRARVRDSSTVAAESTFTGMRTFTTRPARDWYVRPGVYNAFDTDTGGPLPKAAFYGKQDGTSYADAWNGIFSVAWGENGVEPGDTLYVCGIHLYTGSNLTFLAAQGLSCITESGFSSDFPITIRMDSPVEPGLMWGAARNLFNGGGTWNGPDANNVYWSSNLLYSADFWADGTNVVLLDRESARTWNNHPGAAFYTNGVWYVKTPDGQSPAAKICSSGLGYRFHLGRSKHLLFYNCRFYNAAPEKDDIVSNNPSSDTQTSLSYASYITFDKCDLKYSSEIGLTPGQDYWTFRRSELSYGQYGIYAFIRNRSAGVNGLTVQSNYIHDIGTDRFPHIDAHAIGVQGGEGYLIEGNTIENSGAAIEFWTAYQPMRDHVVRYNLIKNVRVIPNGTSGGGITISGDNVAAVAGLRTGFKINGNIIINPGVGGTETWQGHGIAVGSPDFTDICNNTIVGAAYGITVAAVNVPAQTRIVNNAIVTPKYGFVRVVGGDGVSTNVVVDYNLYYSPTNLPTPVNIYPAVIHDQHSISADPLFASKDPVTASDVRPTWQSRVIRAGIPVDAMRDFLGTPIPTNVPPDIGALQYVPGGPSMLHLIR